MDPSNLETLAAVFCVVAWGWPWQTAVWIGFCTHSCGLESSHGRACCDALKFEKRHPHGQAARAAQHATHTIPELSTKAGQVGNTRVLQNWPCHLNHCPGSGAFCMLVAR